MHTLPKSAQLYISTLFIVTLIASLLSAVVVASHLQYLVAALALTCLVALLDIYPIIGPNQVETTASTAVKVAAILLLDPSIVVVGTFAGTAIAELRIGRRNSQRMLNVAAMSATYSVMAFVYVLVRGGSGGGLLETPRFILALCVLIPADLIVNMLSVSLVVALVTRGSVRYVWSENFKSLIWHDLSMVTLGTFIAILWNISPWALVFAAAPLALVGYSYQMIRNLNRQTLNALMMLARMLDDRYENSHHHCELVALHAEEIAFALGLGQSEVDVVKQAAYLHDIGKLSLSNEILFEQDLLTSAEREHATRHAALGAELLSQFPTLQRGATYVRHQHVRWDGAGCPDDLKGEQIPLGARILAVSESFQAMIEDRPQRKALALGVALTEILVNTGTQFDPLVVRALFKARSYSCPPSPAPTAVEKRTALLTRA